MLQKLKSISFFTALLISSIGYTQIEFDLDQIFLDSTANAYPPDSGAIVGWNLPIVEISIGDHESEDDHEKIQEKEIQLNSGKSLSGILQNVSGISTISTSSRIGKPLLHGMFGNRLAIITNGTRLESQQWGIEHAPEISTTASGDIEILKGTQGVLYGPEAIAGVILIHPYKLLKEQGLKSSVWSSAISNGRGGAIGGEFLGKNIILIPISWRVSGNMFRSGHNSSPDGILENTGSAEQSFSTSLSTRLKDLTIRYDANSYLSKSGIFSGSHFSNLTDLQAIIDGTNQLINKDTPFSYQIQGPFQSTRHTSHVTTINWAINDHNEIKSTTGYQKNKRQEFEAHDDADIDLDLTLETVSSRLDYSWFKDSCEVQVGVNHKQQSNIYRERPFIPNMFLTSNGLFGYFKKEFSKININGGLRFDQINLDVYRNSSTTITKTTHEFSSVSIQGQVEFLLDKHTNLNLKGGRAWRPPSLAELYASGVHHGAASIETGNPNLEQEIIWEVSSTLHYNSHRLDIELSPYYNYFDNYIYLKPTGTALTVIGAFPTYSYTNTRAHFYGFDFFGILELNKRIALSSNTSLTAAFDLSQDDFLPFIPPFTSVNSIIIKLGAMNTPSLLSFGSRLLARQKRYSTANEIAAPPAGYSLVDIGFKREFKSTTVKMEVLNVLNKRYRNYLSRLRYFAPDPGRSLEISLLYNFSKNRNN